MPIKISPEIIGKRVRVVRDNSHTRSFAQDGGPVGSVGQLATIEGVTFAENYVLIRFDDPPWANEYSPWYLLPESLDGYNDDD